VQLSPLSSGEMRGEQRLLTGELRGRVSRASQASVLPRRVPSAVPCHQHGVSLARRVLAAVVNRRAAPEPVRVHMCVHRHTV
jgi:hypothetical protein